MKNAKGEDCTKFKNAASEVQFNVKFAGTKWTNFARGWQKGEDLGKGADEESNLVASNRFEKVNDSRAMLREDAVLATKPQPGDSKHICAKFSDLKKRGLIVISKPQNDVNNPDAVTRLLKWGDTLKKEGAWEWWLSLERLRGWGPTVMSNYAFASTFLGIVRNQPDTMKYVLTVLKMAVAEAPELTKALQEDCLKGLKSNTATMKNVIGTLALAFQVAKFNIESLKKSPIDSEEKMKADFVIIELALTDPEAFLRKCAGDSSGVIGNMSDGTTKLMNFVKNCLDGTYLQDMRASFVSVSPAVLATKDEKERSADILQSKMQHASVRQHMKPMNDFWKERAAAMGSLDGLKKEDSEAEDGPKNLLEEGEEAPQATPKTYKQAAEEHAENVELRLVTFMVDPKNTADLKAALKNLEGCRRVKSNAKRNAATEGQNRGAHYDQSLVSESPGSFL